MIKRVYLDIETFSSVDLKTSGLYKYVESPDFEVLILSYAFDDGPVVCVDLALGEEVPEELEEAFFDDTIEKWAHNATFERVSLRKIGYDISIDQWHCSMIKAVSCGLPFGLDQVSKALDLVNKKLDTGKNLIRFFSMPCKPTISNRKRTRNYPEDDLIKWQMYKDYNIVDVEAEREIILLLDKFEISEFDKELYILDQEINDRGILVDMQMAKNATMIDEWFIEKTSETVKRITHLSNPNSPAQLKTWLTKAMGKDISTLAKAEIPKLIEECEHENVRVVLLARQMMSKSSVKKYAAMLNCAGKDDRTRGLFQFYGANRTGRWAGRLVQLQNLSKNHFEDHDDLLMARNAVKNNNGPLLEMLFDDVSDTLSQLVRTTFIAKEGHTFMVADFNAIEARVLSWLADEKWRLEVFATHGKIYEASASVMFNVPLELVTKDSEYRMRGKNAELALGYQGALGAMQRMGGEKMGLSEAEMWHIVKLWRTKNPKIVELWADLDECSVECVKYRKTVVSSFKQVKFTMQDNCMIITLPSGHNLYYWNAKVITNSKGTLCVSYEGINQETKFWGRVDTYGGKLTENIVQAISRDILGQSMLNLRARGYNTVMHVHDEAITEVPTEGIDTKVKLQEMCDIMGEDLSWAPGLVLKASGYVTDFYLKD